ncbi:Os01g0217433 [Oryza sativa Japonica Group]|uniref:Os01g0217433 protein n=3 Tax=Oryza sativa TaxID=4530 RepID=B9EU35_ORYSJ|nr:hypothetical protein OsI_00907 [Oryza sativa Indica Group]EEE54117.1 hypothetical protein OsJ_00887 [Oryza sativa Japonica Group]BAS71040.1 Os01g0217433 [Oryza sativa Japonica Group]
MPPVPDHRRRLPQSHTLVAVVAARDDLGSGRDSDGGRWRLGTTLATSGGSGGVRWRAAVATAGGDHGSVFGGGSCGVRRQPGETSVLSPAGQRWSAAAAAQLGTT